MWHGEACDPYTHFLCWDSLSLLLNDFVCLLNANFCISALMCSPSWLDRVYFWRNMLLNYLSILALFLQVSSVTFLTRTGWWGTCALVVLLACKSPVQALNCSCHTPVVIDDLWQSVMVKNGLCPQCFQLWACHLGNAGWCFWDDTTYSAKECGKDNIRLNGFSLLWFGSGTGWWCEPWLQFPRSGPLRMQKNWRWMLWHACSL